MSWPQWKLNPAKCFLLLLGLTAGGLMSVYLFYAMGYRINATDSIPQGLYWVVAKPRVWKRGQIAWLCPPNTPSFRRAREHGELYPGDCPGNFLHWFKPVAALPGDTVVVATEGVRVNGNLLPNSQPLTRTPSGRIMHGHYGSFRVGSNSVWVISSYNPMSFDSRYFGAIPSNQLKSLALPVWTAKH
jgi:conjugative transfer signal peptidase TraF